MQKHRGFESPKSQKIEQRSLIDFSLFLKIQLFLSNPMDHNINAMVLNLMILLLLGWFMDQRLEQRGRWGDAFLFDLITLLMFTTFEEAV